MEKDSQFLNRVLFRLSGDESAPESTTILGWLVKISSIQLEESCKTRVGSEISCFIPYKDVIESSWAPAGVVVSLIDQLDDLALKSPIISAKSAFLLYISIISFFKLLIKESNSPGV